MKNLSLATLFVSTLLLQSGCASKKTVTESAATGTTTETIAPGSGAPDLGAPGRTDLPLPKGDGSGPTITLKQIDGSDHSHVDVMNAAKKAEGSAADTSAATTTVNAATAAPATTAAATPPANFQGTDPDTSIRYLRNGNTRFLKARLRNDGQSMKDVKALSKGEKPHTIVIACSDSRVPPEVIFDQRLGEIFTIRTAGQTLNPEVVASIEHAVANLNTRLIMVLGHTSCSAVHAASDAIQPHGHSSPLSDSQNMKALVNQLRPRIESTVLTKASKNLSNEGWANVKGAAKEMFALSPYLTEALRTGQIRVIGGLYDLETGAVDFK